MSSTLFRFVLKRVARSIAKRGAEAFIEETTGFDVPDLSDLVDLLSSAESSQQAERRLENAIDDGRVSRRQVEAAENQLMTDFNEFMSIGLNQCGSDRETFAGLVEVWNREKDEIRQMSQAQVRQSLTCP